MIWNLICQLQEGHLLFPVYRWHGFMSITPICLHISYACCLCPHVDAYSFWALSITNCLSGGHIGFCLLIDSRFNSALNINSKFTLLLSMGRSKLILNDVRLKNGRPTAKLYLFLFYGTGGSVLIDRGSKMSIFVLHDMFLCYWLVLFLIQITLCESELDMLRIASWYLVLDLWNMLCSYEHYHQLS